MGRLTHEELVSLSAKYLARTCPVVLTECCVGGEAPDAIGWRVTGVSTVIECKTTYSDFKADFKKVFRVVHPNRGVGQIRYYLTEPDKLPLKGIPRQWGLIEVKNGKFYIKKKPTLHVWYNTVQETKLLISALRRMTGVSVNFYEIDKPTKTTLGVNKL